MDELELPALTEWHAAPARPILGRGETHVWRVNLAVAACSRRRLHAMLSPDEQARAARYRREDDGHHFVVARGALRMILARYLDLAPEQVAFEYGPHGKPMLHPAGATSSPKIAFNLAHSHGLALCAIACDRRVGVDLELIRPAPARDRIAERFFAAREVTTLRSLPGAAQPLAFFRCWTRKEAFLKAQGAGLTSPLNGFEVSLGPGEPPALLSIAGASEETSCWLLREVIPAPGFVGALAVEGSDQEVKTWNWQCHGEAASRLSLAAATAARLCE